MAASSSHRRRGEHDILALAVAVAVTAALAACRRHPSDSERPNVTSVTAAENPLPTATVQPGGPLAENMSQNLKRIVSYAGLSTPSDVFVDAANDRYLVTNIAGALTAVDDNGFVSAFSPSGAPARPRWIAGGHDGVTLNAPKGLAVARNVLYVADIDTVRAFDATTGAPRGAIRIPGALYLAGMAVAPDGRVLVADAGVEVEPSGDLRASNGGAIWRIDGVDQRPTKLATSESLGGPAALSVRANGDILVATLGDGSVYVLDKHGEKHEALKAPRGKLDGVAEIGDKIYVSSWEASAVYRRLDGGTYAVQLAGLRAPGGLAVDAKRSYLVVPLMTDDRVEVFAVQ